MTDIKTTVLTALFTALISAGAYITFPIGPVPITLQTLFIILAGLLGGKQIGLTAAVLYLVLGSIGLPVFSGGTGSIGHLFGPTGGYLLAAVPAALSAGIFRDWVFRRCRNRMSSLLLFSIGALVSTAVFYAVGFPWLKWSLKMNWTGAFAMGVLPFIPGDIIKAAAAAAAAELFGERIDQFIHEQD